MNRSPGVVIKSRDRCKPKKETLFRSVCHGGSLRILLTELLQDLVHLQRQGILVDDQKVVGAWVDLERTVEAAGCLDKVFRAW